MLSEKVDPREMSAEQRLNWALEVKSRQTGCQGCAGAVGFCALYAIKNPVRKNILKFLEDEPLDREKVSKLTGLEDIPLTLQIAILEYSYLVETEGDKIDLTPSGVTFVRTNNI